MLCGLAVYRFVRKHRTEQKHLRVRYKKWDVRCVMQSRVASTTTQFFSHTNPKVLFTFYHLLTLYLYYSIPILVRFYVHFLLLCIRIDSRIRFVTVFFQGKVNSCHVFFKGVPFWEHFVRTKILRLKTGLRGKVTIRTEKYLREFLYRSNKQFL